MQSLDLLDATLSNQTFYTFEIEAADASTFIAIAILRRQSSLNGTFTIDQTGNVGGVLTGTGGTNIVPSY